MEGVDWGMLFAAATIQLVPILVFVIAVQRYVLAGLSAGEALGMWVMTGVLERFPGLKVVFVEPMAIWCTNCRQQMHQVTAAHELADFHSVSIDVEPTEIAEDLVAYAAREGFDWPFVLADAELATALREREQSRSLAALGVTDHRWLGHRDGDLPQVRRAVAVDQVAGLILAEPVTFAGITADGLAAVAVMMALADTRPHLLVMAGMTAGLKGFAIPLFVLAMPLRQDVGQLRVLTRLFELYLRQERGVLARSGSCSRRFCTGRKSTSIFSKRSSS